MSSGLSETLISPQILILPVFFTTGAIGVPNHYIGQSSSASNLLRSFSTYVRMEKGTALA